MIIWIIWLNGIYLGTVTTGAVLLTAFLWALLTGRIHLERAP